MSEENSDNGELASNSNDTTPNPPLSVETEPVAPLEPVGFEFRGDTMEYFKIWIVNLMLSVVTLGFYIPWAKVRSRRYLYANTFLDGHGFDYLAKPINLLFGYLIVLVFGGVYFASNIFNPLFVIPLLLIYGAVFPWLVYKALRFKSRNTAYRNVRFDFQGQLGDSYTAYLWLALAVPFTLGFIIPYMLMRQKEYFLGNLCFGKTPFTFKPTAGNYYKYYIISYLMAIAGYIVFGIVAVAVLGAGMLTSGSLDSTNTGGAGDFELSVFQMIVGGILYAGLICGAVALQQWVWIKLFFYNLSVLSFGDKSFKSTMTPEKFIWISITNALATIFTLGLMYPWATIRARRYMFENSSVMTPNGEIGSYIDSMASDENAIGESASEFLDFEIGL